MSMPILECVDLTKSYNDSIVVNKVNFTLYPGEILSILGPSGAGKTTMLRLVAGFENPDSGEVKIRGNIISNQSTYIPAHKRNIGMVFQDYALFPHKTISENLSFGLHQIPPRDRENRLRELISLVSLEGFENRYPHELSGGQQQRTALARTIGPRPVAVLLDEPFSNLDATMRHELRQEVEKILRESNIATLIVTHNREEAFTMADRIGIMREGRLEQLDTPEIVYRTPANRFVAQLSSTCSFLEGHVKDKMVKTELGNFPYFDGGSILTENSSVSVLVHLNDFELNQDPEGNSVVVSREFHGDETILSIQTPSGTTLKCRQIYSSPLTKGTTVSLVLKKKDAFTVFNE